MAVLDDVESTLAERDRYREALKRLDVGCPLDAEQEGRTCLDISDNQDDWCYVCIAHKALKP